MFKTMFNIEEQAKSIIRCYVTKNNNDFITQDDLESVVYALLMENQKLQSKIESLETNINKTSRDLKNHKLWSDF